MALVTLAQARAHVKIGHFLDDSDLTLKLQQAISIIVIYLKRSDLPSPIPENPLDIELDDLTSIERFNVQAAIFKVVALLDAYRGDDPAGVSPSDEKFLTPEIRGMLASLRDPALA